MTVSSSTNRDDYAGNGSTTSFAVSFRFLENSHIKATLRDASGGETLQIETTNYTLTGAGDAGGGTLVMLVPPVSGETLTILRDVPATQETDYVENDEFPAESHEDGLDKLTMLVQQQGEDSTRHIGFSETVSDATGAAVEISQDATQRADKFLGFDSAGNIETKTASSAGLVDQSAQDKRYGPIFATVAAMTAANPVSIDGVIVTLVAGMRAEIQGYTVAGGRGSKKGIIAASQSVDGFGDHTNANGTVFLMDEDSPTLEQYGCAGDWDGATGTDDSLAMAAAIDSNKPIRAGSGKFRITQRIDLITTERLRLVGVSSAYKDTIEDEEGLSQIICDGTEFFGGYDFANQKLDPCLQRIIDLRNIAFIGVNSSSTSIVTTMNGGAIRDCHFKDFDYHGMIDAGGVQCELGPNSFDDCGLAQSPSGAIDSDTFIDGCAMLSVGSVPVVQNNNFDATRALNSATFGSSKTVNINVFQTVTGASSFKGMIASNQRSMIAIVRSYQGVWIGNSQVEMPSPHLEVFANGGEVAGDGEPYALAYFNSTVYTTDDFFVVTPNNTKGGPILQKRSTAFGAATDFWGHSKETGNESANSRSHIECLKVGQYIPSTDSTPNQFPADLGSAANPIMIWDDTSQCFVVSKGTAFYPAQLSQPLVESSTIASAATFDFTTATIIPDDNLNGDGGRGVFEVDVEIVDVNNGSVFYHGVWKAIRQLNPNGFEVRFYELGHVDNNAPAGGFTVTENGAGPFTLRVTNNTAFGYRCTAKSRRTGLTQTYVF